MVAREPEEKTAVAPLNSRTDGRSAGKPATRARIVAAARELFSERGYRGATTLDVAASANVAERTIFRHFPTKAALFREAAIEPVERIIQGFIDDWGGRQHGVLDLRTEVHQFYERMFQFGEQDRRLLISMLAALFFEDPERELFPELAHTLGPLLDALEKVFEVEARDRGFTLDPAVAPRLIVGMALGVTVHGDWLFPGREPPPVDVIITQLTELTTSGLTGGRRPS
ncbi:TetR/AcrR family transcriptional regulator [Amycolatopsis acidicola]|uniref:TetR/AcrR family transcriptional regulator n=1 Tax=Amycolatopsis acidicola TaxID=2596893 RepID=UPI00140E6DE1|nr:TetR/AcrR family transcriptional regulator [Amycolatopsis acidicola]